MGRVRVTFIRGEAEGTKRREGVGRKKEGGGKGKGKGGKRKRIDKQRDGRTYAQTFTHRDRER